MAFTDFGLRALMRPAGKPDRSLTTDELATDIAISRHHLTKVVRELAVAGVVKTRRDAGGGLRLARPSRSITLGEVVRALERDQPIVECFRADGGACVLTPSCRLKKRLAVARDAFLKELEATTLADQPEKDAPHLSRVRSATARQGAQAPDQGEAA
jgi:Rrf2 family nitric oxide-sensitive transcriptional repressor